MRIDQLIRFLYQFKIDPAMIYPGSWNCGGGMAFDYAYCHSGYDCFKKYFCK